MKSLYLAVIATGLVVTLGASLVASVFFIPIPNSRPTMMLEFDIPDQSNMPDWCMQLSSLLDEYSVKGSIFIAGKVAERHPSCVRSLSSNENLDIGSMTYSYISLPDLQNYTAALDEVQRGKQSVDDAGMIFTQSFRAPFGKTDEDIYSILNRTSILADFSYTEHYNKSYRGYYIWFNVTSYNWNGQEPEFFKKQTTSFPTVVRFDNYDPIDKVREFIIAIPHQGIQLRNASDLTNFALTERRFG